VSAKEIISENFAPSQWLSWPRSSIRVVDWNIDRGLQLRSIIDFLGDTNADIFLLQEVDINARRTQRLNIAQEIAQKLRLNYVFGREFVELTQGSNTSPAYHGQATLSRWKISNSRILRFREQPDFWKPRWYLPKLEPFQERLGGRIALVSETNSSGVSIVTYNLHLESRANDELRLAQLDGVLKDARACEPGRLAVIAGDLNLNASKASPADAIARYGFINAVPTDGTGKRFPICITSTRQCHRQFHQGRSASAGQDRSDNSPLTPQLRPGLSAVVTVRTKR